MIACQECQIVLHRLTTWKHNNDDNDDDDDRMTYVTPWGNRRAVHLAMGLHSDSPDSVCLVPLWFQKSARICPSSPELHDVPTHTIVHVNNSRLMMLSNGRCVSFCACNRTWIDRCSSQSGSDVMVPGDRKWGNARGRYRSEKLSTCVFMAIVERRQFWKSERKGIWHADGWWVNNTKCPALYGLQSLWLNFCETVLVPKPSSTHCNWQF